MLGISALLTTSFQQKGQRGAMAFPILVQPVFYFTVVVTGFFPTCSFFFFFSFIFLFCFAFLLHPVVFYFAIVVFYCFNI